MFPSQIFCTLIPNGYEGITEMLTEYIQAAMKNAKYELFADGTYYGEIPDLNGVYSNADSLDECRRELQEVLEGWIVLGLRLRHELPVVDGIELNAKLEKA